jgi:hypothetical protein
MPICKLEFLLLVVLAAMIVLTIVTLLCVND